MVNLRYASRFKMIGTQVTLLMLGAPLLVHGTSLLRKGSTKRNDRSRRSLWNEDGHEKLLKLSVKQLFLFPSEAEVVSFNRLWSNIDFQAAVFNGIEDADSSIIGEYGGPLFASHFYDPDIGCNYIRIGTHCFGPNGHKSFLGMNAKSEGIKRMDLAIACGKTLATLIVAGTTPTATEFSSCGFQLGLSLHYVTDLTQPMHAANFGNGFGGNFFLNLNLLDSRHTDLEEIADNFVDTGYLDSVSNVSSFADITSVGIESVGDILEDTARKSKSVWTNNLKPITPSVNWFTHKHGSYDSDQVKQIIDLTMGGFGYINVAKYLTFFGRNVAV